MADTNSPKALRERRAPLAAAIHKLVAEDRTVDASGNYTEEWVKLNADYDAFTRRIEASERSALITATMTERVGDPIAGREDRVGRDGASLEVSDKMRTLALGAWCRAQYDLDLDAEQAEACRTMGFNPRKRELALSMFATGDLQRLQRRYRDVHPNRARDHCGDFRATLTQGSGPSGGYLIAPEQLRTSLEVNMLAYGGVRQVAETIRTASGEMMSWPTADDTTNSGAQLGESTTFGSSVDPSFGKVLWSAYKFSSKPILVPYELLQDAVFDLPSLLGAMMGERLGRITNTKYTTGTGAATAKGIVTCATSFSAASATAITFDDVMGLEHSIDPAYRMGSGYMAHDSIFLALRKLKDGEGQPIWQSNWQAGMPDRLNGYSITTNQDMDSTISSGKKTLLFGQLSRYKIRSVGEARMYRLEERYRDLDQDGFVTFIREDGNLLTAGTAPVKYLSH